MPDYSKSKIYEIICNLTKERYIGSTIQALSMRLCGHRTDRNMCKSKQIIERGDYYINLLEDYSCENKEQLLKKEREWFDNLECINAYRPIRIDDDIHDMRQKKYYDKNRDNIVLKLKEKRRSKNVITNDIITNDKISADVKTTRQKKYVDENRDNIVLKLTRQKKYYLKNKDKIVLKLREKRATGNKIVAIGP
jgi:hypothetical protein